MEESILLRDAPGEHAMLIGTLAMTRACLEAGIQFVSQYPGTPVTDIGTYLSRIVHRVPGLYFQWASNESASISAAVGASWCGIKSLAIMKHVGVNVAADALYVISQNGPTSADGRGGLLVICGGDPGSLGSHSEQNDRFYSWMLHLCHFEPSNVVEAKQWIPLSLDISQKFDLVSFFRVTSRIAHTVEEVELNTLPKFEDTKGNFIKDIPKFCSLPPHCINNHKSLYERMERLEPHVAKFNQILPGDAKFGIVFRYEGGLFHPAASVDLPPALADFMVKQGAFPPRPGQLFGRLCESKTVINVVDRSNDPEHSPPFRYGTAPSRSSRSFFLCFGCWANPS